MRNLNTFYLLLFAILSFQNVLCQGLILEYSDSREHLTIQNDQIIIRSEWVSPSIQPAVTSGNWEHTDMYVAYDELAGRPGHRTTDVFSSSGIVIERQVWISTDRKVIAIRNKLSNFRNKVLTLHSMIPLSCNGKEAFQLLGNPDTESWYINAQKRRKKEFPETIRPSGDISIIADPFLAIPVEPDPEGPCLIVGYLDWSKHLAHLNMSFKKERGKTVFDGLTANCEFDDVVVPPNGERTTQWIYITLGQNFNGAVDEYADRVASYHHIPEPPKNAPTVYCSWYWYGKHYTEKYFLRDLEALNEMVVRKPFDVFLIDESWGLFLWGDYKANKQFPSGMKFVADRIKEMGYIPGIWTPPYLVSPTSELVKKHPDWVLKSSGGEHYTFQMNDMDHWVIDPTYPGVLEHLEESFRKLSEDWGFAYFKFDFMRALFLEGDYQFYNPAINRLEAYRMGLEAIRRGVGDDAYISVCGGHYGGSLGLANSQRSGSDVVSFWNSNDIRKYRQGILRTWMNRLWHVDPDAMMVRRNETPEFTGSGSKLSLGLFTDKEAQVNALIQYISGGLVSFAENYKSLDSDRLELYKHVIPSVNSSSVPLDWYDEAIPSMAVTYIDPVCNGLEKWNTLAVVNWTGEEKTVLFQLDEQVLKQLPGNDFILFEFFSQEVKGRYKRGELVSMGELDPHSGLLIKIIPWDGVKPVLAGTDLHFSMGGIEIRDWKYESGSVEGAIQTDWLYPVNITTVFPAVNNGFEIEQITVHPNQKRFWVAGFKK